MKSPISEIIAIIGLIASIIGIVAFITNKHSLSEFTHSKRIRYKLHINSSMAKVIAIIGLIASIVGIVAFITNRHSLSEFTSPNKETEEISRRTNEVEAKLEATEASQVLIELTPAPEGIEGMSSHTNETETKVKETDISPVIRMNSTSGQFSNIRLYNNNNDANNNSNEVKSFSLSDRAIIIKFEINDVDDYWGTSIMAVATRVEDESRKEKVEIKIDQSGEVTLSFSPQTWDTERNSYISDAKGPKEGWYTINILRWDTTHEVNIDFWIGDKN